MKMTMTPEFRARAVLTVASRGLTPDEQERLLAELTAAYTSLEALKRAADALDAVGAHVPCEEARAVLKSLGAPAPA
jgi:hypothetical protein